MTRRSLKHFLRVALLAARASLLALPPSPSDLGKPVEGILLHPPLGVRERFEEDGDNQTDGVSVEKDHHGPGGVLRGIADASGVVRGALEDVAQQGHHEGLGLGAAALAEAAYNEEGALQRIHGRVRVRQVSLDGLENAHPLQVQNSQDAHALGQVRSCASPTLGVTRSVRVRVKPFDTQRVIEQILHHSLALLYLHEFQPSELRLGRELDTLQL